MCYDPDIYGKESADFPINSRGSATVSYLWPKDIEITYFCFKKKNGNSVHSCIGGTENEIKVIKKAISTWLKSIPNLKIVETMDRKNAMARFAFIGRNPTSMLGITCLSRSYSKKEPYTTNFGKNASYSTALHEVGHFLGLRHEHQRSDIPIVFNTERLKSYYKKKGWSDELIQINILNKYESKYSFVTQPYDFSSIMHYGFKSELIIPSSKHPKEIERPTYLSAYDKQTFAIYYSSYEIGTEEYNLNKFQSIKTELSQNKNLSLHLLCSPKRTYCVAVKSKARCLAIAKDAKTGQTIKTKMYNWTTGNVLKIHTRQEMKISIIITNYYPEDNPITINLL